MDTSKENTMMVVLLRHILLSWPENRIAEGASHFVVCDKFFVFISITTSTATTSKLDGTSNGSHSNVLYDVP